MDSSRAKGLFFVNLSVLGAVFALGIYQIPQPWRGALVAWLLVITSVGVFALKLAKHHYQYKSDLLKAGRAARTRTSRRARRSVRLGSRNDLSIVRSGQGGRGRYTIR